MRSMVGVLVLAAGSALAEETPSSEGDSDSVWAFKLTPSLYLTSNQRTAADMNLRASLGDHALWLGHYWRDREFEQTRVGYEYTAEMPFGKLVPSLQWASHGFVGGSVNAEIGGTTFGLLGFGRTNAKDYYNLNFDPNDSALYGFGTRLFASTTLSLYQIRDNRLHTEQKVSHFVWRRQMDDRHRWTVDVFSKRGRPTAEEDTVIGTGISATYDFNALFFRFAWDPKVNFSNDNQTRLTLGFRF